MMINSIPPSWLPLIETGVDFGWPVGDDLWGWVFIIIHLKTLGPDLGNVLDIVPCI
jgi:hypothetical protein